MELSLILIVNFSPKIQIWEMLFCDVTRCRRNNVSSFTQINAVQISQV